MNIKGTVNNKLYFFREKNKCKSEIHLREFLKINGFRQMFFVKDNIVDYVSLKGDKQEIGSLEDLNYNIVYKISNNLTKLENNGK